MIDPDTITVDEYNWAVSMFVRVVARVQDRGGIPMQLTRFRDVRSDPWLLKAIEIRRKREIASPNPP